MLEKSSADLRTEQSSLEAEIAKLQRDLQASERELAERERTPYPASRGLVIGLLLGGALVFVLVVCFLAASFFA